MPLLDAVVERVTGFDAKRLVVVPLIVLLLAASVLAYSQLAFGTPVKLGMDFTGGTLVRITTAESKDELLAKFSEFPNVIIREAGDEKILQFGPMSNEEKEKLIQLVTSYPDYEIKDVSPLFGKEAQAQTVKALVIAFLLMAIVIFIVFRTPVPAAAIVFCAVSDIIIAAACLNLVRLELSLGTVAALLMLIGYSVDSNILLTTKLLRSSPVTGRSKKSGMLKVLERLKEAMRTGLTMTSTTLSAVFAMFVVAACMSLFSEYYAPIPLLRDISIVLIFGLFADLMNTWMFNAGVLRFYLGERAAARAPAERRKDAKTARVEKAAKPQRGGVRRGK
ncbi:protein translocase subunit SecF [Candidatus Alkanophaga liquidiphilum]|nr:Preprotein translocase subunit SecF [Candidatus Alkanophaga liquidiphilum]